MAKKVLSIALALLMMFNVFAVAVSAASDEATISLSVDKESPKAGDTVNVTVSLKSTYKVFALQVMLAYDNTFFELVGAPTGSLSGATFSSVADSATLVNEAKENGINVDGKTNLLRIGYTWKSGENAVAFNNDTAVATFQLKVKADAGETGAIEVADKFIVKTTTPTFDPRIATYVGKGTTTIGDSALNGQLYGNSIVANNVTCTLSTGCDHIPGAAVKENEVAATPTTPGSYDSVVYCTVCNEELSRETISIPASGHTAGAVVVENEKPATCTDKGSYDEVIYCTCCSPKVELSRTTKTTNALGHKEVDVPAVAATCTKTGLTAGKKCSVCGTVTVAQVATPKLAHTAGAPVEEGRVEATPTVDGYYYSVTYCKVCGTKMDSEKVAIPATGHVAGTAVREKVVEATCYSEGSYDEVIYCTCCSPKVELSRTTKTIEKAPHTEVVIPGEAATCTKTGLTDGKECTECWEITVEQEVIPVLPHTEEVIPGKAATCTATGLTDGKKCSVCGTVTVEQTTIEKAAHSYEKAVTAPTCEDKGYTTYTCTVCGDNYVADYVDALGHKNVIVPGYAATCTATGLTEGKKCSVCGVMTTEQTVIDALGHKEAAAVEEDRVEPDCTTAGSYNAVVYCSVCGEKLSSTPTAIPETGHTPGEAQEENRVEATFETEGSYDMVVRCTVCSVVLESETVVIPAGKDGPADYEALDALVDEAEALDRSIYKNESLDALDAVLDKITYDMKAGQQSIVDGWAEELKAALDAMEIDDTKAEAKVTTIISKDKVKAGDIVTVTVNLTTNFYVTNLQIPVLFDQTQFEVVGTKTNKNYLTISDMFTSRNYNLGGRADRQQGFDKTSNADLWNTADAKAQYGVAYMTATYDASLGKDDTTYAKAQGDVFATFQLKALKDVEDTSNSVFVSTDWAKTKDNKTGMLVVGMTQIEDYDATVAGIDYTKVTYEAETIAIAGVTVSGTVKSFDDKIDNSDDVTITLTATDSDAVYTTTVTGSGVQTYALEEVVAGTYTATVSKANHVTRTYEVVVGEENVEQELVIHLLGDITGDGRANTIDVARANANAKNTTPITDAYLFACVDINGDGKVNTIDVARINANAKGTAALWK